MGSEQMALNTTAGIISAGTSGLIKQLDLVELIMNSKRDELEQYAVDSIGKGQGVMRINVPTQDFLAIQSMLYIKGVPFASDISKEVEAEVNDYEFQEESQDLVMPIYVKDVDVKYVIDAKAKLLKAREEFQEFEDLQTSEKMFEGTQTCFIDNLRPVDVELIAKEFEKQCVNYRRLYNKETKTMSLEVEAAMFDRANENELSRAERALHDAILKGYSENYVSTIKIDLGNTRRIKDLIQDEILNDGVNANKYLIFDAMDPKRYVQFLDGAVVVSGFGERSAYYRSDRKDFEKTVSGFINEMSVASAAKSADYMKEIEIYQKGMNCEIDTIDLDTPDKIELYDQFQEAKRFISKEYYAQLLNENLTNELDELCESAREEQALPFRVRPAQDKENQAIEIRIPDTDKVFETVISISPQLEESFNNPSLEDPELKEVVKNTIIEEVNNRINELKITNPAEHVQNPDFVYVADYEKVLFEESSLEDVKVTPKAYDNSEKVFLPEYDRDHNHTFDKSERNDRDLDGIPDDKELNFGDEELDFGDVSDEEDPDFDNPFRF